jgi:hypothetical protein
MSRYSMLKSLVAAIVFTVLYKSAFAQSKEDYGQLSWSYEVVENFDGKIKTASIAANEITINDEDAGLENLKETFFVFNKHYDYNGNFLSQNLYIAFKFLDIFDIQDMSEFLPLYRIKIRFSDSNQIFEPAMIHKNYMSLFFIQEKSFENKDFQTFSKLIRTKNQMFVRMEIEEYKVDFSFSLSGSTDALNMASQTK